MCLRPSARMLRCMYKRTAALLAVSVAAVGLALPAGASAARAVHYVGKTTGGHKVTFDLYRAGTRIKNLFTATPVSCLAMQSGYSPMGGMDSWNPPISFPVNQDNLKWKDEKANTGFYYNHVTKNYEFSTRKLRNGTIRGTLRQQFQFLVPKYPPGTFVIYGCLGVTRFTAKPVR